MKKTLSLLCALLIVGAAVASQNIIPRPVSATAGKGVFRITPKTVIVTTQEDLQRPAELFSEIIKSTSGFSLPVVSHGNKQAITLRTSTTLSQEEYLLTVTPRGVEIVGGSPQGVFYGLQTLRQLHLQGAISAVTVQDKPYFGYRGAMLDVARHFFSVEDVKTFIDMMSMHKLNRFHWHLTEDQGWRIEIKKYPDLTRIGSMRKETLVGLMTKDSEKRYDGKPYGGFYTQDQIREIVQYAAERYIEVIPEIEMPGHGLGALTAYPWLGCTGGPYAVWTRWGISDDVYCAGKESTFEFVENVLTEVLALFPSKYIHIGGDECPKGRWKKCPICQERIRKEGLKNEDQLQSYFIRRVEAWLNEHDRKIIGWDEILQGGISKTATIMTWRDQQNGVKAAQQGNHVIMTPKWNCYFDYGQTSDPERYEPIGNRRYVPVRQVYRLDPCDRLTPAQQTNILGVQANLWTEYIPDLKHIQHMVLPRFAALSEVAWSYDRKDYNDFARRAQQLLPVLYKSANYNYAPYFFQGIE